MALQPFLLFHVLLLMFSLIFCEANVSTNSEKTLIFQNAANVRQFSARVTLDAPIKTTDDRFLSVTLDTSIIRHNWAHFDTSSVKLKTLARGLSPVYLRLGGTSSDFLIFRNIEELGKKLDFVNNDAPDSEDLQIPDTTNFDMTSNIHLNKYIEDIAKAAAKKVVSLYRMSKLLMSDIIFFYVYKATIHLCMEYCCHFWAGVSSSSLSLLDRGQQSSQLNRSLTMHIGDCTYMIKGPQSIHKRHLNQIKKRHIQDDDYTTTVEEEETIDIIYESFNLEPPQYTPEPRRSVFDWVYMNEFVRSIPGWKLIFDLNVLQRTNGRWDPSINASSLLVQSSQKGYCLAGFELGNEPDSFFHILGYRIDPTVLGKDFRQLSKFKSLVPCMGKSIVIGPDVTARTMRKRKHELFLKKFLQEAHASLDAVTIHHYYVNGRTATSEQFMDPDILDSLKTEFDVALNILAETSPGKPFWLGETSSAFGGGSPGLSDVYIAGFMWMDKLGLSARNGISVVMRQSFYKGHYALIDFRTLDPRPDYWLSFIFKKLVGNKVLDVSIDDQERKMRLYAHCTQKHGKSNQTTESVTFYGMNLYEEEVHLKLSQFSTNQELHIYMLEPNGPDGILSKNVNLNGKLLQLLNGNQELPPLIPRIQKSNIIRITPRALVFIVVAAVNAPACRSPK